MHAIQTSGNCIRNVTADHFAGVAADEIEDPRPWCEIIRQWSTFHPEFSFLPRKFKIAVTGAPHDRAAVQVHDIGLRMHKNDAGEIGFEVIVGGGLGRTPMIGVTVRDFLPKQHLLSYLEAILRVYNLLGRRDNMYKARIKILVAALGRGQIRRGGRGGMGQDQGRPADPAGGRDRAHRGATSRRRPIEPGRSAFRRSSMRQASASAGLRALGAQQCRRAPPAGLCHRHHLAEADGGIPGDATAEQMDAVADLADALQPTARSASPMRRTWCCRMCGGTICRRSGTALDGADLATANIGLVSDIIACPGLDYCSLATARSIPIAQRLAAASPIPSASSEIGELRHQDLGLHQCLRPSPCRPYRHPRRRQEGRGILPDHARRQRRRERRIGEIIGPAFSAERWSTRSRRSSTSISTSASEGERFLDAYRRLGPGALQGDALCRSLRSGRVVADPFVHVADGDAAAGRGRDHRRPGALAGGARA